MNFMEELEEMIHRTNPPDEENKKNTDNKKKDTLSEDYTEIKLNDRDVIYVLTRDLREVRTVAGPGIFYLDNRHEDLIEKHMPECYGDYMDKFKGSRNDIPTGYCIFIEDGYMIYIKNLKTGEKKAQYGPQNYLLEYYELPTLMNVNGRCNTIFLMLQGNTYMFQSTTHTKDMFSVTFEVSFSFDFKQTDIFNYNDYITHICDSIQEKINKYFSETMLTNVIKSSVTSRSCCMLNMGVYCYNFQMTDFKVIELLVSNKQYKRIIRQERREKRMRAIHNFFTWLLS